MRTVSLDSIVALVGPAFRTPVNVAVLGGLLARNEDVRTATSALLSSPSLETVKRLLSTWNVTARGNKLTLAFAALTAISLINRLGTRLLVTRQPRRKIVWSQHIVVITGGARGIGGRVAEMLTAKGARVVVLDMLPKSDHGKEALYIKTDVTDLAAVEAAKEKINSSLGKVTMLVVCAGIARNVPIVVPTSILGAEWSQPTLDINAMGSLNAAKIFGLDMLPAKGFGPAPAVNRFGGHMLFIASSAGYIHLPSNGPYNMSKAAVLALRNTLENEMHHWHKVDNVRVSAICPMRVETAMTKGSMALTHDQFTTPDLTVDDVAGQMVRILEEDKSVISFAPFAAKIACFLFSNLPGWAVQLLIRRTGSADIFREAAERILAEQTAKVKA